MNEDRQKSVAQLVDEISTEFEAINGDYRLYVSVPDMMAELIPPPHVLERILQWMKDLNAMTVETQSTQPAKRWPEDYIVSIGNGLEICKGCRGVKFTREFPTYKNNPNRRRVKCYRCLGLREWKPKSGA